MTPPRVAQWLARLAAPRAVAESYLDDLAESFERVAREHGPRAARR